MKKVNIIIFVSILGLFSPRISDGAELYKPFIPSTYCPKEFNISQGEFRNGNILIRIVQAKKTPEGRQSPPHFCRAWLEVNKSKKTLFRKYYGDIEPVGYSYGLFVPEIQPPRPFFAIVKQGDYDGRLFLVHTDGKVWDLMGGSYFISKNKRYLFSSYASDISGLAVFDLKERRVVFSSDKLPEYPYQWYTIKGAYFFTASEWLGTSGAPSEKKGIGYFYDLKSHKIIEKGISRAELADSKSVAFDFDPQKCPDCNITNHKSLKR